MNKTLIVGCSYVHKLKFYEQINHDKYKIHGSSGAGNQAIASRVIHEISKQQFNQVVVLWSGINRLDMPVPLNLHKTFDYKFFDIVDNIAWYHSGGIGCSGQSSEAPRKVKQYFDTLYVGADNQYLSELTLMNILAVQTQLKTQNVPFKMCFIYDIQNSLPSQHEVSHGTLSKKSCLFSQIDWSVFKAESPWEWASTQNQLDQTGYYPTQDGYYRWFREQMDIDLV